MGMKGHCLPRQWWQDGSEHVSLPAACGEVLYTRYRTAAIHIHRNPVDTVRAKAAFRAAFAFFYTFDLDLISDILSRLVKAGRKC